MKLLALNLFVSICMFFNALGFNSYLNPNVVNQQAAATETPPAPSSVSETGLPAETPTSVPTDITTTNSATISGSVIDAKKADFKISFKSPHLNIQNQIILRYEIGKRFAPDIKSAEISISLMGDKPVDLFRIPVLDTKGESSITIKEGCEAGCTLGAALMQQDGSVLSSDSAEIKVAETFNMAINGGELKTKNSKISVRIGSNALKQDLNFYVLEDSVSEAASHEPVTHPFFIDADTISDGQAVNTFDEPIQLIYTYDEGEFTDPARWSFVTFNEEIGKWEYLPTEFDLQNHQIIGYTTHLSEKGLNYNAIDKFKFDNLLSAQTSQFTGAATYSYPISVLAGPGGLTPSISLSYNSNIVDGSTERTQASWVGMGWNLDVGSISRNTNGTDYLDDDTFSLSVNGTGGVLIPYQSGTDETGAAYVEYKTQMDNFWRIRQYPARANMLSRGYDNKDGDISTWKAWDKGGTKYVFSQAFYYVNRAPNASDVTVEISRWALTTQTNIFGQSINYSYAKNPYNNYLPWKKTYTINGYSKSAKADMDMYIDTITYGQHQIVFVRNLISGYAYGRLDFDEAACNNEYAYCTMDYFRLDKIIVKSSTSGNGVFDNIVQTYQLGVLNNEGQNTIFAGITWPVPYVPVPGHPNQFEASNTGRTLTLTSIQKITKAGVGLPPTTFSYNDRMHLTSVNNGYNGKVEFVYENDGTNPNNTIPWPYGNTPINYPQSNSIFEAYGGDANGNLIAQYSQNASYSHNLDYHWVRPGGVIHLSSEIGAQAGDAGETVQFKLYYHGAEYVSPEISLIPDGVHHEYSYNITLPKDIVNAGDPNSSYNQFIVGVYCHGGHKCEIAHLLMGAAVTR